MSHLPRFTIIIPVHNKLPHLDRSINSVLNQTFRDFELIIVDDASTDGSSEKLLTYKDDRIKYFRREIPGPGGYAARNLGINTATSEWILFLDADDKWENILLETVNDALLLNKDVELVCWSWLYVNSNKEQIDSFTRKNKSKRQTVFTLIDFLKGPRPICTIAVALRKDVLIKIGCFPEGKFQRGGDLDTWIRYLAVSRKNLWLNKTLSFYYTDSVNMVTKTAKSGVAEKDNALTHLFNNTDDKYLKKAIIEFQNSMRLSKLHRYVSSGKGIDYKLLSKVRVTSYKTIYSILLIYVKLAKEKLKLSS